MEHVKPDRDWLDKSWKVQDRGNFKGVLFFEDLKRATREMFLYG